MLRKRKTVSANYSSRGARKIVWRFRQAGPTSSVLGGNRVVGARGSFASGGPKLRTEGGEGGERGELGELGGAAERLGSQTPVRGDSRGSRGHR